MSKSNAEDEEETVEGLNRRLDACEKDKNDLKTKVVRLEEDLLARDVTAKSMDLQVTRLEEEKTKLMAENESLLVAKRE